MSVLYIVLTVSASLGLIFSPNYFRLLRSSVREKERETSDRKCQATCRLEIIEDFPEGVPGFDYSRLNFRNTYDVYKDLFGNARREVLIIDSSSNLRAAEYTKEYRKVYAKKGNEIFELLRKKGIEDGVDIKLIDVGAPFDSVKYRDAEELHQMGVLERRTLDTKPIVYQHAKALIIDDQHTLVTSSNLDYQSMRQKGELGVLFKDCPCFAADLKQVFNNMWNSANSDVTVSEDRLPYNHLNRLLVGNVQVHTALSPDVLREKDRDSELGEIVRIMDEAERKIDISVMDFVPFYYFQNTPKTLDVLTEAVARAISRGVQVRLLTTSRFIGFRNQTIDYLEELDQLGPNIQIKLHSFPYQNVYMNRKSHGKSVVTEKEALISTSNFTPDYFARNAGLSVVMKELGSEQRLLKNLDTIFARFWDGAHSYTLSKYVKTCLPVSLDLDMCDAINSPHNDTLKRDERKRNVGVLHKFARKTMRFA